MEIKEILSDITAILKAYDVEKIILFGSYANGNPDKESDIDLLVIKDIPEDQIRAFRLKLKKALWTRFGDYDFDVLVDSEQRIKQRIEIGDLFYKEIYSEGITIYA
jgi:uncharacterized protein